MKGWKYEGWRHSLASKGIRTVHNSYFASISKDRGLFPEHKVDGIKDGMRERDVHRMHDECVKRLREHEDKGELYPQASERFMESVFKEYSDDYMNDRGMYSRHAYEDNLRRRLDDFISQNSKNLKLFDWGEAK